MLGYWTAKKNDDPPQVYNAIMGRLRVNFCYSPTLEVVATV
jgi:hypothetical protein